MKKLTDRILSIFLSVLLLISVIPINASAQTITGDCSDEDSNVSWSLDTETGVLTIDGEGAMKNYELEGNTKPTAPWLTYKNMIKQLIIGDNVTTIGNYAFYDASFLSEITLSDNVKKIGFSAFYSCNDLKNLTIPKNVNSISYNAFTYCKNLESITVDPENKYYCSKDDVLFNQSKTSLILYPAGKSETSYTAPTSVTSINDYAFCGCNNLTSIILPDTVTRINSYAFLGCENLSDFTIPSNVITISWAAFRACEKLESVIIPDSTQKISGYAFFGCSSLKDVVLGSGLTEIGEYAFSSCPSLENVTFSSNLTKSGFDAFYGSANIKNVYAESIESWLDISFLIYYSNPAYYADNLYFDGVLAEDLIIPEGITAIKSYAFYGCSSIKSVELSNTVETISNVAFNECPNLTKVTISDSITSMSYKTFRDCTNLEYICYAGTPDNWNETVADAKADYIPDTSIHFVKDNKFDVYTNDGNATCTANGTKTAYCGVCEATDTIEIENSTLEHSWEQISFTESTCTQEGHILYKCKNCPATSEELVPVLGHSYSAVTTTPTCTEEGYTTYTCIRCNDSYVADYVRENGHNHEASVTIPATHLTEGIMTYTCSCGDTYTQAIAKTTEHKHNTVVTAPTCTNQGYTTYTCECGDCYITDFVNAEGHELTVWVNDEENGVTTRECIRCEYIETAPLTNQGDGDVDIIAPENPDLDFDVDEIEKNGDTFVLVQNIVNENNETNCDVLKVFDITLKNLDGVHVQPNGTVKVKLPLDWEKDGNYKVYRVNDDGTLTDMNAYRQGSHMVFDTDHFSIYVIVEEKSEEAQNTCSHMCHKSGFIGFIWKIINFFSKLFGANPICECGIAHY